MGGYNIKGTFCPQCGADDNHLWIRGCLGQVAYEDKDHNLVETDNESGFFEVVDKVGRCSACGWEDSLELLVGWNSCETAEAA